MRYDYQISSRKKNRFLKKIYIFISVLFILGIIVIGLIRLDMYLQSRENTPEKTTTEKTTSYFAPTTNIFRTKYFQFQGQNNWTEIASESTENKFVYRSQNRAIIEQELTVYVGKIPTNLTATRLLPVEVKDNKTLVPGSISEHCNETVGGFKTNDQDVSYKGVRVKCDIDNTEYKILVGQIGGSTVLKLARPDGTNELYSLYYRNVKAVPDANDLLKIVESFQTR